jgi:uncharacterized protein YaeQ
MKIRGDLHVNGGARKLLIVQGPNEKGEHMALKLAAFVLFWNDDPIMDASTKHPALVNQEFLPDLMALSDDGTVKLWVECGSTTLNKLDKIIKRFPYSRIVVVKETLREAKRLRAEVDSAIEKGARVEILAWPDGAFKEWVSAVGEKTEIYGEGGGLMINAVVNEKPIVAELSVVE